MAISRHFTIFTRTVTAVDAVVVVVDAATKPSAAVPQSTPKSATAHLVGTAPTDAVVAAVVAVVVAADVVDDVVDAAGVVAGVVAATELVYSNTLTEPVVAAFDAPAIIKPFDFVVPALADF